MRSQVVSGASHELSHLLTHLRWVAHDVDARRLESGDLLGSASLAAGNDGASVAHAATWRCRLSSDEAHNGQIAMVVGLEPGGGLFLGLATDLANHDDALGLGVIDEALEHDAIHRRANLHPGQCQLGLARELHQPVVAGMSHQ